MAEPVFWLRAVLLVVGGYAATALLTILAGGLGVAFFTVLAFSLAANSCLTLDVIAATSTL